MKIKEIKAKSQHIVYPSSIYSILALSQLVLVHHCDDSPQLTKDTWNLFLHLRLQVLGVGLNLVELIREVDHVEEGTQVVPVVVRVCTAS